MTQGVLTPEQQLKVLSRIWGASYDGYVFLPWISGKARSAAQRRDSFHEGRAYLWPKEKPAILEQLHQHDEDDLYFTPALFNGKRRTEQNVDAEHTLWADLDPVDPEQLDQSYRPTIAWQTSPGRYQAAWIMNEPKVGASWAGKENHRLTLYLGADPSGWDGPQLLRVPGRPNHKPTYGDEPAEGKLLWDNGPRYQWLDFDDLPEVGLVGGDQDIDLLDEDLLNGVDRHALWATVRLKVSKRIREFMASRSATGDRSSVLWEIERELADAGCSVVEIIALVRPTPWNKYSGRADELKRLKVEAAKAIGEREDKPLEREAILDDTEKPKILWLSDVASKPIARPRWLIRDIWTKGGCGFISGAPKSYKSWLALDMAATVAMGDCWLGQPDYRAQQANVLYLQEEDSLGLVMQRLATIVEAKSPGRFWQGRLTLPSRPKGSGARGAQRVVWEPPDGDIPLALHVQTGFVASDPGWHSWLDDVVAEGKFGLVTIDTLGTTAGEVDTDRSTDLMNKILRPLKTIAQQHDAGVCVVHHNRKTPSNGQSNGRAGNEMLGSVALHAWVDCAIYARVATDKSSENTVQLEREAKQSTPLSLRMKVPRMYESLKTGERQLWEPEIISTFEDSPEAPPPAEQKKKAARPSKEQAGMSGKFKTMHFQVSDTWPASRLEEVLGNLGDLAKSGWLRLEPDGRYTRLK